MWPYMGFCRKRPQTNCMVDSIFHEKRNPAVLVVKLSRQECSSSVIFPIYIIITLKFSLVFLERVLQVDNLLKFYFLTSSLAWFVFRLHL